MAPPSILIKHAYLAYHHKILFNNLNLTLPGGKWTCLLGPSGVGKSSLLRMIAHLKQEYTAFRGIISDDNHQPIDHEIAYMAQTDLLMPWLTVLENALIGTKLRGSHSNSFKDLAKELLQQVGLKKVLHLYPNQLSLGMRQRVALVRTLLSDKPIVLMDEPFSALDAITRFALQNSAASLLNNHTVLLVTHDPIEALRLADEIFILGGDPATITLHRKLSTPTPRDPTDPEFIKHQAELFHALITAKEMSA